MGSKTRMNSRAHRLSPREQQVLDCLSKGWDNSTIAEELNLAEKTVRNILTGVYRSLGVSSRAEAIVRNLRGLEDNIDS